MRASDWLAGVVVPARNEEESIGECVRAIRTSLNGCPRVGPSWIVVVADACTDRTAERARAALGNCGEVVECVARSPGSARRIGVATLLRRFADSPTSRLWIANTDADSKPASDWVDQQLNLASQGCAGVAGIVRVETVDGLGSGDVASLLDHYVVNEDGSHPHVHGANLGIRADAYLDAGGWKDVAVAEDHCLWSRIRARNWPTISSTSSVVLTSGRLVGRATGGFADSLRRRLELRHA